VIVPVAVAIMPGIDLHQGPVAFSAPETRALSASDPRGASPPAPLGFRSSSMPLAILPGPVARIRSPGSGTTRRRRSRYPFTKTLRPFETDALARWRAARKRRATRTAAYVRLTRRAIGGEDATPLLAVDTRSRPEVSDADAGDPAFAKARIPGSLRVPRDRGRHSESVGRLRPAERPHNHDYQEGHSPRRSGFRSFTAPMGHRPRATRSAPNGRPRRTTRASRRRATSPARR
jgi:hypothetical protein